MAKSIWDEKIVVYDKEDVVLYNQDGTFFALHLFCAHCLHEEFLQKEVHPGGFVIFGSDADFCTSCGNWWECW